jgi:hypothetical protein
MGHKARLKTPANARCRCQSRAVCAARWSSHSVGSERRSHRAGPARRSLLMLLDKRQDLVTQPSPLLCVRVKRETRFSQKVVLRDLIELLPFCDNSGR